MAEYTITNAAGNILEVQELELESHKVRVAWDNVNRAFYFSVVDVVGVLTEQNEHRSAAKYWSVLKVRLQAEGSELPTNCSQLKMMAEDGKMRLTDVADKEQLFRIIQSIPSKKAEPIKQWLAKVGALRIDQAQDPELSIDQAIMDYRRLGHDEAWINQRIKTIEVRKKLTDEWKERGLSEHDHFALLTNLLFLLRKR